MSSIEVTRNVSLPAEQVWALLADFGGIHRFHPVVASSPLNGDQTTGLGASRTCHFHDGNHVVETIVGWDEGRSLDIAVTKGSMPLRDAKATLSVEPDGPDRSVLTMRMAYTPKFGVVGQVMDVVMIRRRFGRVLANLLAGLEEHGRTGALIGPDFTADQVSVGAA